jgi:hypothetical protein
VTTVWHLPYGGCDCGGGLVIPNVLSVKHQNNMSLNISAVENNFELLTFLRGVDLSVPGRIYGRTTDQTETWVIARLLSTLASSNQIAFPLTVTHRDRPDTLIQFGSQRIGLEITEAISEQYAAYCAIAEREFPNAFIEPGHFRWHSPNYSTEEMPALLRQSQMTSEGWAGNRPEQEWALFINSAVNGILAKLANSGFEKFDQNWLSIYDNLPLPNVNLGNAIELLKSHLQKLWYKIPGFNKIYVEHGPVIACITSSGAEHLILNDIWD